MHVHIQGQMLLE